MKIYLIMGLFFLGLLACKDEGKEVMLDLERKNYTSQLEVGIDGTNEVFIKDLCGEKIGVQGYRKDFDDKYYYSNDGFFVENKENSIFISLIAHTLEQPNFEVLEQIIANSMQDNSSQDSLFLQVSYWKNGVVYSNLYFENDQNTSNIIFNSELKVEIDNAVWNESFDCLDEEQPNVILKGTISGKLYDITRNEFVEIQLSKFDLLYIVF